MESLAFTKKKGWISS